MKDNFSFLNIHWMWPVAICAVVLLLVFLWKEWSQAGKHRFGIKALLVFLGIAALAILALKPALPTSETTGKIVLLTPGYEPLKLDSLNKKYKRLKQLRYSPGMPVPDEIKSAERVFVLGNGIKPYDLWQLDAVPASFLGATKPEGVVKLNYRQENSVGDRLVLKGLYQLPAVGNQLILEGPGGESLDSVRLNEEDRQQFELSSPLKVSGNYVYSLVEKDSLGALIGRDPLPVQIGEKDKLRVLVINSFPTFETKYLKNFLAETGHELVVRSQITTGRFKYEYFNTEPTPINSLKETTLAPFDLLIIDAVSVRNLPVAQMTALENSVREKGLGIFIQADEAFFNARGTFNILQFERVQETEVAMSHWPENKINSFSYRVNKEFGVMEIHNAGRSIVSAYKQMGQGRISSSVLQASWQLVLDGHNEIYRELWSRVVEQVSKKEHPVVEWGQENLIAYQDEPFDFHLRTTIENPGITNQYVGAIALTQDIDLPTTWTGTTWPRETGWNQLRQDTLATYHYYVSEETHWSSLTASNTIAANHAYFNGSVAPGQGHKPLEPVNPLWFFGVFLICVGGLWLEPKL